MNELFSANTPAAFWRVLDPVSQSAWEEASGAAAVILPSGPDAGNAVDHPMATALSESQFGEERYRISGLKSIYYAVARPLLPTWVRPLLRKVYHPSEEVGSILNWPIEDRYVRFQFELIRHVMKRTDLRRMNIVGLWPDDNAFAFVLTHDVEGRGGHDFVRQVMDLEEQYGFRSSFNFVPEGYEIDRDLLDEIRSRGFEVGVHGLKHDGRLFSSPDLFAQRAKKINAYAQEWRAVGFRSPMTHRNPEWMQALDINYDLSFFDTDPYEPMAGGSMSIWPYFIGKFVELPYTLMQDHRYLEVLEQRGPDMWLEKVEFIEANHGMALLNSHPDYLLKPGGMAVYESFLAAMATRRNCWHALPCDVADWWRYRHSGSPYQAVAASQPHMPRTSVWTLEIEDDRLWIKIPGRDKDAMKVETAGRNAP